MVSQRDKKVSMVRLWHKEPSSRNNPRCLINFTAYNLSRSMQQSPWRAQELIRGRGPRGTMKMVCVISRGVCRGVPSMETRYVLNHALMHC